MLRLSITLGIGHTTLTTLRSVKLPEENKSISHRTLILNCVSALRPHIGSSSETTTLPANRQSRAQFSPAGSNLFLCTENHYLVEVEPRCLSSTSPHNACRGQTRKFSQKGGCY